MNLRNKRALVTGAGGFIGSHLVERLANMGVEVTAFVRYNSRNDFGLLELLPEKVKEEIDVVMGDLRDPETIQTVSKDAYVVFHLGALIDIPYSYVRPREVVETNIMGALNILSAAREFGVKKVVHTSTSEVYGTAQYTPIDENHPLQGQSPYSASKIGADKLAESFHRSYNLPVTTIRPFNTYGPRQSTRAVIPTIVTQALTRDRIYLGSLHPIRDFTYVGDTVDAFVKIAESNRSVGEVINIGSGSGISIGDLANKIISLAGKKKLKVVFDPKRVRPPKSEVERLVADSSKARKMLGWKTATSLDDGLRKTIEWMRENIGLYKVSYYFDLGG